MASSRTVPKAVLRWIRAYFPRREQPYGDDLVMWAQDYFGKYAGYANQLLFHEQRELTSPRTAKA